MSPSRVAGGRYSGSGGYGCNRVEFGCRNRLTLVAVSGVVTPDAWAQLDHDAVLDGLEDRIDDLDFEAGSQGEEPWCPSCATICQNELLKSLHRAFAMLHAVTVSCDSFCQRTPRPREILSEFLSYHQNF